MHPLDRSMDLLCHSIQETSSLRNQFRADAASYHEQVRVTQIYGPKNHLQKEAQDLRKSAELLRYLGQVILPSLNQAMRDSLQVVRDRAGLTEEWLPISSKEAQPKSILYIIALISGDFEATRQ